jgi:hypothetical protein
VLCLRRCCSNGHDDISSSLSHGTVHTSERGSVRSLLKASRSASYRGRSKPYPRFSTYPCSCSSPALFCSFATSISRYSSWCYRGVGLCTALYGCITCMPIFRHDSPYYTPLSLPAWHIITRMLFPIYLFLRWFNESVRYRYSTYLRFRGLEETCRWSLAQGMWKTTQETALSSPSEIDTRAFMWTFDCLDEDHELKHFFSGLPGFRSPSVVRDPLPSLTEEEKGKLFEALQGLLDRTFSSDLLPAPVKNRRAMVCAKAVDPEHTPDAFNILGIISSECQYRGSMASGIVQIVRSWRTDSDEGTALVAEATLCVIIARALPHDDSWFILASSQLGVPETSLRDFAAHGDSLSLAILIHLVRQQFIHFRNSSWPGDDFSFVLEKASKFNAQDTSPELQHDFCALWNQIVHGAQGSDDEDMAYLILRRIRNVYLALHQDTDSAPNLFSTSTDKWDDILEDPSSYPVCKVPGHCSDSTPHIHDDDVPATKVRAIPHDPNNTAFVPSLTCPDPPSSSTHAPLPVHQFHIPVLPLDNPISVQGSTQAISQTMNEGRCIPTPSPGPLTTCTMHGMAGPSSRTMYPSPSEPSPSIPPNLNTSQLDGVAVEHIAPGCTDLNVLLPSPSTPVLGDMLSTGL